MEDEVLGIRQQLFGNDHPEIAMSCKHLGKHYRLTNAAKALSYFHNSVSMFERHLGATHATVAYALKSLGCHLGDMQEHESAFSVLRRAVHIAEGTLGPQHPEVAGLLLELAKLQLRVGPEGAEEGLLGRSIAIYEATLGPNHPTLATAFASLAHAVCLQGQLSRWAPIALLVVVASEDRGASFNHSPQLALRNARGQSLRTP
eukprot:gene5787-6980_t